MYPMDIQQLLGTVLYNRDYGIHDRARMDNTGLLTALDNSDERLEQPAFPRRAPAQPGKRRQVYWV